jgi:hypothetical protein
VLDPTGPSAVDTAAVPDGSARRSNDHDPAQGDSTLDLALLSIPAAADHVAFTDVSAVARRLGYAGLTGESPTQERFAFWESARADGAMLTGSRLYDASSVLALDYGWTAEDVDWEVDFSAAEFGCLRAMLCGSAHGYVIGLRKDLDWRTVVDSFAANGYTQQLAAAGLLSTERPGQPFTDVLLIPELHAVASGNEEGLGRIADVVAGAPSVAPDVAALVDALGQVESTYLDPSGCVSLGEALGLDATPDDVTAYFKDNDPSGLAEPDGWAVGIAGARAASAVVAVPAEDVAEDARLRAGIVAQWPGVQTGVALADVATTVEVSATHPESFEFDVAQMPSFASMVLTHDAPWALCPARPPA